MATVPHRHQIQGLKRLKKLNYRALCSWEMSLGKSYFALMAAQELNARPTVVVCPACLKINWSRECSIHLNWQAVILGGRSPPKHANDLMDKYRLFIINYDVLGQVRSSGRRRAGPGWLEFLRKLKPQLIVLDESHFLKGHRSKRTKWVRELCEGIPHILALSGTPLTNRPAELWPIINILWPETFYSWPEFGHQFCQPRLTPWGVKYDGAEKLDVLHGQLIDAGMLRKTKAEVLKHLPAMQRIVVPMEMSRPKEYAEAADDLIGWLMKTSPDKARRARRAQRLVRFAHLKKLAALLKLDCVCGWIDNFLEGDGGKLALFAHHWEVRDALCERYGRIAVRIDGGMAGAERMRSLDRFNKDDKIRLLVGQTDAAGVGLNFTGGHTGAMLEFPWNPAALEQAAARFHGFGRGVAGKRSTMYLLVAAGTIEEELLRLLDKKQKIIDTTLDGGNGRHRDFNLTDMLERRLLEQRSKQ